MTASAIREATQPALTEAVKKGVDDQRSFTFFQPRHLDPMPEHRNDAVVGGQHALGYFGRTAICRLTPAGRAAGCFKPNGYGLHDMIGNAWEMTSDFHAPAHSAIGSGRNPQGPAESSAYDPQIPALRRASSGAAAFYVRQIIVSARSMCIVMRKAGICANVVSEKADVAF